MLKKKVKQSTKVVFYLLLFLILIFVSSLTTTTNSFAQNNSSSSYQLETPPPIYLPLIFKNYNPGSVAGDYVLLGWNDLGMHCYNADFQDLAVLPPYNNLWAQVVRRGDPPVVVTDNIEVTYAFPDNTYSVGKSNFWDYAQELFGLDSPLPANIGLTGKGMSGNLDVHEDHFAAEGIPLTEFSDSAPTTPYPYQKAEIKAFDLTSGEQLAGLTVVAPVSTEMHCDNCHSDGDIENISTGRVETNILTLHDMENQDEYPAGHRAPLMDQRPVLCATCHASNALAMPGISGIPNLSNAIHDKHDGKVPDTLEGCYNCHPGPTTECLRGVMATEHDMDCVDCHGGMEEVSKNPNPWLNEPTCGDSGCHTDITQDQPLYRNSKGHGEIYCAACHDSPHAIAPSSEANDGLKFIQLQGFNDTLRTCTVCHLTQPTAEFWHNR